MGALQCLWYHPPPFYLPVCRLSMVSGFGLSHMYHLGADAQYILLFSLLHPDSWVHLLKNVVTTVHLGRCQGNCEEKTDTVESLACHKWQLPLSVTVCILCFFFSSFSSTLLRWNVETWTARCNCGIAWGFVEKGREVAGCNVSATQTKQSLDSFLYLAFKMPLACQSVWSH